MLFLGEVVAIAPGAADIGPLAVFRVDRDIKGDVGPQPKAVTDANSCAHGFEIGDRVIFAGGVYGTEEAHTRRGIQAGTGGGPERPADARATGATGLREQARRRAIGNGSNKMNKIAEIFTSLDYGPAPEAADVALAWLAAHDKSFGHFINGAWTKAGKTFATENPATGKTLAQVTDGTAADVDAAVKAARAAFSPGPRCPATSAASISMPSPAWSQKHSRLFAVLETMDNGKPIRESRDIDIPLVARHFYHHAGWAQLIEREFPDHVPYGVCGQIIPWNFPLLMLAWKIAPALAAGNTVVLKPAEFTSLTALLFAEICRESRPAAGRGQHRHRRGRHRRRARQPPRRRQDRLHRLDRGRQDHPRRHRRLGQEALARARRQVALHRVRRCRSRQRRRRRGRRHLVQPGPGLLRRLAPPGPGERSKSASSPS